ncbi:unnamed protein product, partial [Prorocentrum cordatum]
LSRLRRLAPGACHPTVGGRCGRATPPPRGHRGGCHGECGGCPADPRHHDLRTERPGQGGRRWRGPAVLLRLWGRQGPGGSPRGHGAHAGGQSAAGVEGDTEATLGGILATFPSWGQSSIATKANPSMPPHYSLSRQSVIEQCETSLDRLGLDCVDLFYLHSPDIRTSIDDTLDGVDYLHKAGKIVEFGLSNYPAWAIVDIWHRCKARGIVLPTVYQGMYNVITRDFEREVVPVARQFGLRLYMYNPLAGGLLSGRYSSVEDLANVSKGRFSTEFDAAFGGGVKAGTGLYRGRYSKAAIFGGLELLREACAPVHAGGEPARSEAAPAVQKSVSEVQNGIRVTVEVTEVPEKAAPTREGVAMASVALRWLLHHSLLRPGDGVILGVSKVDHLVANLAAWHAGPLPSPLVSWTPATLPGRLPGPRARSTSGATGRSRAA